MRGLQGRLQSMQWFISQLANKSQPFTKTLHKGVTYDWNKDCDKGFTQIKQYLANPPILMPPITRKVLILYISTIDTTLGVLLAQKDHNKKERAIYYISKTLVPYEANFNVIEKACIGS